MLAAIWQMFSYPEKFMNNLNSAMERVNDVIKLIFRGRGLDHNVTFHQGHAGNFAVPGLNETDGMSQILTTNKPPVPSKFTFTEHKLGIRMITDIEMV